MEYPHRKVPIAVDGAPNPSGRSYGFHQPPYADPNEVMTLLKLVLGELHGCTVDVVRTLESGVVEEQAVVSVDEAGRKRLLLRVWPVFYSPEPRVEYRLYDRSPEVSRIAKQYLQLLTAVRRIELMEKA
jgi:hypothetical protein